MERVMFVIACDGAWRGDWGRVSFWGNFELLVMPQLRRKVMQAKNVMSIALLYADYLYVQLNLSVYLRRTMVIRQFCPVLFTVAVR
jgi:hypothetical protein